ncbi:uncharacterized protein LOC119084701 [Bradysia coprophila]|uniref:uncharacterized protein LOC119084701 n=1 Tax=Bradysia coprophila TaxID=38358 RepID=UPI00187D7C94|nr:uncharacterized protein LOC119084701 [Bradysia coprophila]
MALPKLLEVECLLCKEIIQCQQNDTSTLVDHVNLKHPDIKIANLPKELKPKSDVPSRPKTRKSLKKTMEENQLLYDMDGNVVPKYTENGMSKKRRSSKNDTKRRRFYKTSVETWKPGRDKILCPKCDAIVRPIIRRSADRVSHSSVGAALIMTCWPFCFFPFLFPAPVQENLHCSICGYYFGSYDYQNQKMNIRMNESQKPKTEYLETEPSPPPDVTEKLEGNEVN